MRVLHIVAGLDTGGVATLLYQYFIHLTDTNIKFDFVVHKNPLLNGRKGYFEYKFEELGCNIYTVVPKKNNIFKNLSQVNKIIKNGNYDIVHVHNEEVSFLYILLALLNKIKVRVVHAHYAYKKENIIKKNLNVFFKRILKSTSNVLLACSKDAGISLYGKNCINNKNFYILHNAIDLDKFTFSKDIRAKKRKELGLNDDDFAIIDVGRFTYQKNPFFAIDIFNEILKKNINSKLIMVGIGELLDEAINMSKQKGIQDKILFLGARDDVNELLQAADTFLLPTRFEGLGIVYIEAQAASLETIAPLENVPKEIKCTEQLHFISYKDDASLWATKILQIYINSNHIRKSSNEILKKCGYDINTEAKKLYDIYSSYLRNNTIS